MCLDCGCENANLLTVKGRVSSLQEINLKDIKPLTKKMKIGKDILSKNNKYAEKNRKQFNSAGVSVVNFMSSPGAGKTSLLCALKEFLPRDIDLKVVVGDLETEIDATRLKKHYDNVEQINTISSCHLDAEMLTDKTIDMKGAGLLLIENIGNLVCPASFDLGEHKKVALISLTEGEEKPLKYPLLFKDCNLVVITKTDLKPHLSINIELLISNIRKVNSEVKIIMTNTKTLEGLKDLSKWLIESKH
ncbi:MAG: hydrogenase nickel incorporation protein HypB [Bacteriovoracaceae bacterium]|nr:hydrogenase nickel incorporation protein HypB [Bacteriovoracaceae bacterium]